jgi:hypothetical protein
MRRFVLLLLIALLLFLAPVAYRYLRYYGLPGTTASSLPQFNPANILPVATPSGFDFVDDPEVGHGFVLLDQAHGNDFVAAEIASLDARLAARGYNMLSYTGDDELAAALRPASALVVIAPMQHFSSDEVRAVSDFVNRGGHLLLIGDPTRFQVAFEESELGFSVNINNDDLPLNDLANEFGIVFRGDYLYNTTAGESEGNYRNIVLDRPAFAEERLAEELEQIVFYGSHSLEVSAGAEPLFTSGTNTWSSQTQRSGELVLAATGGAGRVLALGDLTFLADPYNRVSDNARFIAHVADFLVEPARDYILADFPYTFDQPVDVVFLGNPALGPSAFSNIGRLQEQFALAGQQLTIRSEPQEDHDTLYLGLFSQASDLSGLLDRAELSFIFDPPVAAEKGAAGDPTSGEEAVRRLVSPLGEIEMAGTTLFYLTEEGEQDTLLVLAASSEGLDGAIERLLDNARSGGEVAFADCLLQETLAFCPSYVQREAVETQLELTAPVQRAQVTPAEEGGRSGASIDAINATVVGTIALGQTRAAELASDEAHAWTFAGGPALLTLTLVTSEEMDGVLQVYDEEYELVAGADEALAGEPETLDELFIPGNSTYTIVVRAFFGNGGSYSLTVDGERAEDAPPVESVAASILVYSDDDGEAQGEGRTGAETILSLLAEFGGEFTIDGWSARDDGPLDEQLLAGYDLVIWTSGDFRSGNQFEDDSFLLTLFFASGGRLLITGATPAFLESPDLELAELADLELAEVEIPFLPGIDPGTIIPLTAPADTALLSGLNVAGDDALTSVLLRGPNSEQAGEPVAVAVDNPDNDGLLFILAAPFDALPQPAQESLLEGLVHWFELQ